MTGMKAPTGSDAPGCAFRFVFRADAALTIGSGHVMRCLTLADALRAAGQDCHFICRELPGHLCDLIADRGYPVHRLPEPVEDIQADADPDGVDYAAWAGVPWAMDAQETRAILEQLQPGWLVLDHYAFDAAWQQVARPEGTKCLSLDDLANRDLDADILVDANFGKTRDAYAPHVPDRCEILLGPAWFPMHPDFAGRRAATLLSRETRHLHRVLVAMGAVDLPNATARILKALGALPFAADLDVTVVLGQHAPALQEVRHIAETLPCACTVQVAITNMPERMADADLAIAAVGGTTWERCALGLPSLMLTIADNQIPAATALHAAGIARYLGDVSDPSWTTELTTAITGLRNAGALAGMAAACANICDGDGAGRIVARLLNLPLTHRPPNHTDSRRVWEWRYSGQAHRYYRSASRPGFAEHDQWFATALETPGMVLRILTLGTLPVGYIRLDLQDARAGLVSICISAHVRGQGLGRKALALVRELARDQQLSRLIAEVHAQNTASLCLFRGCGYTETGKDGAFVVLTQDTHAQDTGQTAS
ncbi:MAG: UDP-2,4-diacetamido-2,4,6-trideoxy-beta-L-altropyranose hydrolase [Pseudomonadota bacterium]